MFFHFRRKVSNELNSICRSNIRSRDRIFDLQIKLVSRDRMLDLQIELLSRDRIFDLQIEFYDPMMQQEVQQ